MDPETSRALIDPSIEQLSGLIFEKVHKFLHLETGHHKEIFDAR